MTHSLHIRRGAEVVILTALLSLPAPTLAENPDTPTRKTSGENKSDARSEASGAGGDGGQGERASEPEHEAEDQAEGDASALLALPEITVIGSRPERAPGSTHAIKSQALERFQYDDAHAVLLQAPGVYVRQEDGVGLRPNIGIRGANPNRSSKVTLMEDGVLFGPAPYSAPAAYYFPLITRITQVRVLKGPAAIAQGPQTVGGAIDFSTRQVPEALSMALDLAGGQYGYFKAHAFAGLSDHQNGFLIEGVHLHNEGFKELPLGGDTGSTRNEWMVKAFHVLDPTAGTTHEFRVKLSYYDEASNESYLGLTDQDFREDPYQRYAASALDRMENHRTSLVADHILDAPLISAKVHTTAYRHDYSRVWRKFNRLRGAHVENVLESPNAPLNTEFLSVLRGEVDGATPAQTVLVGPNNRTFVSQGLQTRFDLRRQTGSIRHHLESGIRLHNDSAERKHSEDGFVLQDGMLLSEGTPTLVTTANKATSTALALHALDAMTWRDLTLTPGIRVEMIVSTLDDFMTETRSRGTAVALMPGIGAYYALTEELGVLAGLYRGFSPPPPGSPGPVKPEYSVNYEAGARYTDGPVSLEAIGFLNDYSNLTDICTQSSGCLNQQLDRQFDAGRANIHGIELFGRHAPRFEGLSFPISAAYTLTRAEFESTFQSADPIYGSVEEGDELPYVPRHQLALSVAVEHARGSIAASLDYVSAMREQAGNESLDDVLSTDSQLWMDLSVRLPVLADWVLYANLRNAFGAKHIVSHRPFGARPNSPRWLQVGAKGEF